MSNERPSAENDVAYVIEGHRIDFDHRGFVCLGCGARLLNLMQFQVRECPAPIPPAAWDDPDPDDPPATKDDDPMWGRDLPPGERP